MLLNTLALIILILLALLLLFAILFLAALPGKIAKERGHRQTEAINVCGWLGLLTGGLLWVAAMIWAYTRSSSKTPIGIDLKPRD